MFWREQNDDRNRNVHRAELNVCVFSALQLTTGISNGTGMPTRAGKTDVGRKGKDDVEDFRGGPEDTSPASNAREPAKAILWVRGDSTGICGKKTNAVVQQWVAETSNDPLAHSALLDDEGSNDRWAPVRCRNTVARGVQHR